MGAFSKIRKMSNGTSSSSRSFSSSTSSSTRSNSFCTANTTPATPTFSKVRSNSLTSLASTISPFPLSRPSASFRNFSRHLTSPIPSFSSTHTTTTTTTAPAPAPTSSTTPQPHILPKPTPLDPSTLRDLPTATPESSDIFSLACIYLDLLTFLLRGKTTDFVKFRSHCSSSSSVTIAPSSGNSPPRTAAARAKPRPDASFHALDPSRLDAWLSHLRAESSKRPEQVFRCVPDLLRLCKRMLAQNSALRPGAGQVREVLGIALGAAGLGSHGGRRLCCEGRVWDDQDSRKGDGGGGKGRVGVKEERERVRSCLMGVAQEGAVVAGGRASACSRRGLGGGSCVGGAARGSGSESGEGEGVEMDAAEAPDVPRERVGAGKEDGLAVGIGVGVKVWKKALGMVRAG